MTLSTCPIATVNAPLNEVWSSLSNPELYALWWDAPTPTVSPEGAAVQGQKIVATSKAFGKEWNIRILVEDVDAARHALELTTSLPLGITVHNHIRCNEVDETHCRVSFG